MQPDIVIFLLCWESFEGIKFNQRSKINTKVICLSGVLREWSFCFGKGTLGSLKRWVILDTTFGRTPKTPAVEKNPPPPLRTHGGLQYYYCLKHIDTNWYQLFIWNSKTYLNFLGNSSVLIFCNFLILTLIISKFTHYLDTLKNRALKISETCYLKLDITHLKTLGNL